MYVPTEEPWNIKLLGGSEVTSVVYIDVLYAYIFV